MDIIIFVISLIFGLILTILGMRNSVVAIFAIVFNVTVFATALVDGITEQIPIATEIIQVSYDAYPALVLPALFVLLSVIKVVKFR